MLDQPDMFSVPVRSEAVQSVTDRKRIDSVVGKAIKALEPLSKLSEAERVEAINLIRQHIHDLSPFKDEPVDFVKWVPAATVHANDYNPNSVAPPEMELLRLSIMADGYTQPIVTNKESDLHVVVDGFHRNRVGKECQDVVSRIKGYLPIVQIRSEQTDKPDRMASTVRHNRARGKHRVDAMSDIVLELKRRNWSNEKIGKQLGMDPDEVLRLAQITGLAEMFADRQFSEAWEADPSALSDGSFGGEIQEGDDDIGSEADGTL
jgi:ParB-like chromosome segregation protein Spo0J